MESKEKDVIKKNVFITGGSRGIGSAVAEVFASHGYDVIINYFENKDRADFLRNRLEKDYGVEVCCLQGDVANEDDVIRMISDVEDKWGKLDVLVNNAGIAIDNFFQDKTVVDFKRVLDVNLVGMFSMCKHAARLMAGNAGSAIVNVSSTNGIDSYYPYSMDYDASKAGVILLTKNLAVELGPNIRVNAVAPGWVNTEMNAELDADYVKDECKKIVLGRFAESKEIAKVIYFLASEDASYINGEVIKIDGGRK